RGISLFLHSIASSRVRNRRSCGSTLRSDLNRRPVRNQVPDFVHLSVRHRDTPISPVHGPMGSAQCSEAVWQAVNHDIAARRPSTLRGSLSVFWVRIRNMNRFIEAARRISPVEHLAAFGSFVITL